MGLRNFSAEAASFAVDFASAMTQHLAGYSYRQQELFWQRKASSRYSWSRMGRDESLSPDAATFYDY
jgi:hypothetical protein